MYFAQWVEETYESIPMEKRKYYSSDKLIAATCYYRTSKRMFPACLSSSEATTFINDLIKEVSDKKEEIRQKNALTEKSIKHDLKRNLVNGTAIDEVFDRCVNYLNENGSGKSDTQNNEALYNILRESGIIDHAAADKLGEKIIKQQKTTIKKQEKKEKTKVIDLNRYRFFSEQEVATVKKRSVKLANKPEIEVSKDVILKIVEEVIRIIEDIKIKKEEEK